MKKKFLCGCLAALMCVLTPLQTKPLQVSAASTDEDVYFMGSSLEEEPEETGDDGIVSFRKEAAAVRSGAKTEHKGCDISKYQGDINWTTMKNAGIDFVIIRAGYRNGLTGVLAKDERFDANMQGAIGAGMHVGVYIYSQAISAAEAEEEAKTVMSWVAPYSIDMPIFMDYEWNTVKNSAGQDVVQRLGTANLTKTERTSHVQTFFDTVTKYGYSVGLYASDKVLAENLNAESLAQKGYTIWAARYGANNGTPDAKPGKYYKGVYDLWQYTSRATGATYGVSSTYLDLDIWYDSGTFKNADYSYVFDADYYIADNADLKNLSSGEAFVHYINYGLKEGRAGSPIFDITEYKAKNQDLEAAFGNNPEKYVAHFQENGMKEGRPSSKIFDVNYYKSNNSDLRNLFGDDLAKYYEHFYRNGYKEGRKGVAPTTTEEQPTEVTKVDMYRLYNPYTNEHLYTLDANEKDTLAKTGWDYEGVAWTVPSKSSVPVYRLYNSYTGEHHYTSDTNEVKTLVDLGWNNEDVKFYSDDTQTFAIYRLFYPNAAKDGKEPGAHHYTRDINEVNVLKERGWNAEGVAWYGM